MAKVTIPWGDGSGDNFYIDYTGVEGSSELLIISDINQTGVERRKTLVFRTTTSNVVTALQSEAYLTVIQKTDSLVVAMFNNTVATFGTLEVKVGWRDTKNNQ
jgi:hypothetical protein